MWWIKHIGGGGLFIIILLLLSCCSQKSHLAISTSTDYILSDTISRYKEAVGCRKSEGYIPYPDNINNVPEKEIRVVVNILDSSGVKHNFSYEEAVPYFTELIDICNRRYRENAKLHLPVGNDLPALPIQIKLTLFPLTDDPNDRGIYMHEDDELYWVVTRGKNRNHYSQKVINKYETPGDSILNIFVLVHHPDSVASSTYKSHGSGIALGQSLKIYGLKESGQPPKSFPGLLQHELGHIFGLSHSWMGNDGCDDTPKHPNCWNYTQDGPCKTEVSNNMMDYNAWESALSPCQIGRMHAQFHRQNSRSRKVAIPHWCQMDTTAKNIIVEQNTIWNRSYDLRSSLIVKKDVQLTLRCRLSMPAGSKILLEPGARLKLSQATIHNSCGYSWQGIHRRESKNNPAQVIIEGKSYIENISEESDYYFKAVR